MKEIALHILDIVQNSIRAQATCITVEIQESPLADRLFIQIKDNGKGMPETIRDAVANPFTTTRHLRKVGLGIPLFNQLCQECGGELTINSKEGEGTELRAFMHYHHIDRLPLGDMASTLYSLIMAKPEIHYIYKHCYEEDSFEFDTEKIIQVLEGVPINEPNILAWIKDYIDENEENLYK